MSDPPCHGVGMMNTNQSHPFRHDTIALSDTSALRPSQPVALHQNRCFPLDERCESRARARWGTYFRAWSRSCRAERSRRQQPAQTESLWQTLIGCAVLCVMFLALCWMF
jgi:hypothetical protein